VATGQTKEDKLESVPMKTAFALMAPLAASLCLVTAQQAPADPSRNLLGVEKVLALAESLAKAKVEKDPAPAPESFEARLAEFQAASAALDAEEAADQWLELFDALFDEPKSTPNRNPYGYMEGSEHSSDMPKLLAALPKPASWPRLKESIQARVSVADPKEAAIWRLFVSVLDGDQKGQEATGRELAKLFQDQGAAGSLSSAQGIQQQLVAWLISRTRNQDELLAFYLAQLNSGSAERYRHGYHSLPLPRQGGGSHLVRRLGLANATTLLNSALTNASDALLYGLDVESASLARSLAEKQIQQLTKLPWGLVDSHERLGFYELLDKRQMELDAAQKPKAGNNPGKTADLTLLMNRFEGGDYQQTAAKGWYLLGLISQGRAGDALGFLERNPTLASGSQTVPYYPETMSSWGPGERAAAFEVVGRILDQKPGLEFWPMYVQLAIQEGKGKEALGRFESAVASRRLSAGQREHLLASKLELLLALGEHDLAAPLLISQLAARPQLPGTDAGDELGKVHKTLLVGRLLGKGELVQAGLGAIRENWLAGGGDVERFENATYQLPEVFAELAKLGEWEVAERLAVRWLAHGIRNPDGYSNDAASALASLAGLYHRAGRHAEVARLLDECKWWGVSDLLELEHELYVIQQDEPFLVRMAESLLRVGRREEALAVVMGGISTELGRDGWYRLLVEMEGEKALGLLERLAKLDPLEERPLIWSAQVLLDSGRLDEAEAFARRAIALDPSDGEQGRGDRMRVYGVMAAIEAKRGHAKEAAFFTGVIMAIRLSEQADQFMEAGMVSKALEMYEQSLTHFADAYCVQSRLAVSLAKAGRLAEAETHYQRAFELMPSSFGRMESHCFGCEGVFESNLARSVAERVFTKMIGEDPGRPQLHYMLGYLRQQQQRHAEAAEAYSRATELDPDYFNAWVRLAELGALVDFAPERKSAIQVRIHAINPLGQHRRPNAEDVLDWPRIWGQYESAAALRFEPATSAYPLRESKRQLESSPKPDRNRWRSFYSDETSPAPGALFASHSAIRCFTAFMEAKIKAKSPESNEEMDEDGEAKPAPDSGELEDDDL